MKWKTKSQPEMPADSMSPNTSSDHLVLFDFGAKLDRYGEDQVNYFSHRGGTTLVIQHDENTKKIVLDFEYCPYFFVSPMPGYAPPGTGVGFKFQPSIVYEILNSELVGQAKSFYTHSRYQPTLREFFLHLEWDNTLYHAVAESVTVSEADVV